MALGAQGPSDLDEALATGPRIIVCISDYRTTAELFERPDVTPLLEGRTVVQFSTGMSKEARECEVWFSGLGASYLDGALLCESEGAPVSEFTALLPANDRAVPLTQTINDGTFAKVSKGGATVDVAGAVVTRIRQQINDAGIDSEQPALLCNWVNCAQTAGYGSEETAAVIKVIRQNS